MPKSILLLLLPILFFLKNANAQAWFATGQSASLMVSGAGFNNTGSAYFNHPNGLATDGTHFLVCDRFNNRILVWNTPPASGNTPPDMVLGQSDFVSNNPGTNKNQLNWPGNASLAANGKLAVADTENDRILLWNALPTQSGQPADVSLFLPALSSPGTGQFYAWPWGVWTDGNRVAAVATMGGALLFWNSFPATDNAPPDYTVKLPQFGTPRNISTDGSTYFFVGDHNAKVTGQPGTFFWNTYPSTTNQPYNFYRNEWIKGEKLSDGKLVAGGLSTIYIWNQMPTTAAQAPDLEVRPGMYKNGDGVDVAYAGNRLYVNNYNGNNVLVFNTVPTTTGQLPDFAVGSSGTAAQTLDSLFYVQNPVLVTDGTRLIASSDFDRAVYIWDHFPDHSGQPYDHKIPMPQNTPLWAAALYGNTFVTGARNTLSVWNDASQISATPSFRLNDQIGSALLSDIRGVALDGQFFYLATQSGKMYVWQGLPTTGSQEPVLTLGSTTGGPFGHLFSDGEYLCAARAEPPTGVDIYRVADLAAGIVTPFKTINSGPVRINQAAQAATFGGALAIASRGDHRVLLWKNPADWGKPDKVVVLGQPDLNSYNAAIGADRLFMPSALLPHGSDLWVGEFKFSSRILKFSSGTTAAPEDEEPTLVAGLYPNPATAFFRVEMAVPENGFYTIDLLDVGGRQLRNLFSGGLSAGQHFISQAFEAGTLASGVYFVRIAGSGKRAVLKLVR